MSRNSTAIRPLYKRLMRQAYPKFRSIKAVAIAAGMKEETARKAMCFRPKSGRAKGPGIHRITIRILIALGNVFSVSPGYLLDETLKEDELFEKPLPDIVPFSQWSQLLRKLEDSLQTTFDYVEKTNLQGNVKAACKSLLWKALQAIPTISEAQSKEFRLDDIADAIAALTNLRKIVQLVMDADKRVSKPLARKVLRHCATARSYYHQLARHCGLDIKDS